MNDIFYKAIKAQSKLDKVMPHRNWPVEAVEEPPEHIVNTIKLSRQGLSQLKIAKELNITIHSVKSTLRRSYING